MTMTQNPVKLIAPKRFGDSRGWFTEVYSDKAFAAIGIDCGFVQDNHSLSKPRFTLRGLHFQTPPHGQDKLVRCIRGRIYDVAVDLRRDSPTYGKWVGAELTAENGGTKKLYAGAYVNCILRVWAQDNKHGKRINAELKVVQFVRKGPAFSGNRVVDPNESFDDDDIGEDDLDTEGNDEAGGEDEEDDSGLV